VSGYQFGNICLKFKSIFPGASCRLQSIMICQYMYLSVSYLALTCLLCHCTYNISAHTGKPCWQFCGDGWRLEYNSAGCQLGVRYPLFLWFSVIGQESCAIAKTTARCALYIAALKILHSPWLRPRPLVSKIFNGLLLGVSLRMFRPNLKFIALSVSEIIGSTA